MADKRPDLGRTFAQALYCAKSLKRIVPFFALLLVGLAAVLLSLGAFLPLLRAGASAAALLAFVPTALLFVVVLIVLGLTYLYFVAGLMENAKDYWLRKNTPFSRSLSAARPRYLSLLGATLLVAAITVVVSLIPFVGGLIAIVLGWLFLVVAPSAVIGKRSAVASLQESYRIFMGEKLYTFLFWLVLTVMSILLFLLASVPLVLALLPIFFAAFSGGAVAALKANLILVAIGGTITVFLMAYVIVFSESAKAFYYIQARKRR